MKFEVYTRDGCPYCDKVKQVFEITKQEFEVRNLGVDFDRTAFYEKFGEGSTFPQVICDGKEIGGCTDTIQYLREAKIL